MGWSPEQRRNANIIISVGHSMGMSNRDVVTALATAMQESTLRNLDYGDRDSLGLFQQRPSQGWGTAAQVTNPVYAAQKFYSTLRGVKGRDRMSVAQAAQAVQRSAFPDAYAKWEDDARALAGAGAGITGPVSVPTAGGDEAWLQDVAQIQQAMPTTDDSPFNQAPLELIEQNLTKVGSITGLNQEQSDAMKSAPQGMGATPQATPGLLASTEDTSTAALQPAASPDDADLFDLENLGHMVQFGSPEEYVSAGGGTGMANAVSIAKQFLGTPYVWGGTDLSSGVDCSGLVQQVYAKLGIHLPRVSYQQSQATQRIGLKDLRAGDLVFWDNSSRNNGADHVAIYAGGGKIIEAPRPGRSVQLVDMYDTGNAWGGRVRKR